jgi:hypothetical protein
MVAAAAAWMPATAAAADADFCWKDSYGRGVGTIPQSCTGTQERLGLLCYPRCAAGMKRVGLDCHSVCPQGMRDDGLFCRAAEYGRGGGYPWKFGDPLNNDGMLNRCRADGNPQGCEMNGAIAYPKCKPGYRAVGCCICRPEVPNCAALGMNQGVDLSCAKKVVVGDPQAGSCAGGQQRDAGLCYPGCKPGFAGTGPVCWGQCPSTHPVACAGGCAKTQSACAQATTDQVLSVLEVVANVALAVATAGGSTAATAGAKGAATAGKAAAASGSKVALQGGGRFAARITKQEAVAIIKKQAKEAGKELSQAAAETAADAVVQAGSTGVFDPEVLAGLDPTGIAGIVVAYAKPVCNASGAGPPPATRGGR